MKKYDISIEYVNNGYFSRNVHPLRYPNVSLNTDKTLFLGISPTKRVIVKISEAQYGQTTKKRDFVSIKRDTSRSRSRKPTNTHASKTRKHPGK